MKTDERWVQRFQNYNKALERLNAAVELARERKLTDLEQQGLIKAFEFTFELSWNVMKDYLSMMGIQDIIGSKGAIRQAFKAGLIQDGQLWMQMVEDRNLSSHIYDEGTAGRLLQRIVELYTAQFRQFSETMAALIIEKE